MLKKILILSFWLLSVLSATIFSYENPEAIKSIKNYFKSYQKVEVPTDIILKKEDIEANSFNISFKPVTLFEDGYRTAFAYEIDYEDEFNEKKLKIYYMNLLCLKTLFIKILFINF